MLVRDLKLLLIVFLILCLTNIKAQNKRAQLPKFLQNSYFELNVGAINYPFSQFHLEEGFTFHSTQIPPAAVRLVLFGYNFNKSLSAQITYMRPVIWMKYSYTVDDLTYDHLLDLRVWMNYAALTFKYNHELNERFSIFAEGGYSIVTRNGYTGWFGTVVKNAKYNSIQMGGGLSYKLNDKWKLSLSANYTPENKKEKQPHTSFISTGFSYHLQPYSQKKLDKASNSGHFYPDQMIQLGYSGNAFSYGINNALEKAYLFWGGKAEVNQGITFNYQKNIFHSAKVFSMDWGVNLSLWESNIQKEKFLTLSIYPLLRFTFLRSKITDAYIYYSVAGPTFISHVVIDKINTGGHLTFQDNVGLGVYFGKQRTYNAEIKIGHYSNGNISTKNPGIKIPLSFNIGFTF